MTDKIFNVLFLCSGNSARSVFAECLINRYGRGKFRGFSAGSHRAGSHPKSEINPFTIHELRHNNYVTTDLRSKDWSEFSRPDAPQMDFVFTVCDKAAAEVCPVWPEQPMTAHWGVEDPAAVEGDELTKKAAIAKAFMELENRISIFTSLPIESLDKLKLQERLDEIGRMKQDEPEAV